MSTRPSIYLLEKCKSLEKAIDFFSDGPHERRVSFLATIDFWDWEMDNLFYSFESFKERAKTWGKSGLDTYLNEQGMLIQSNKLEKVKWQRGATSRWWPSKQKEVVAPWDELKSAAIKWNKLLKLCERNIMQPKKKLEQATKFGANYLTSLDKFRKRFDEPVDKNNPDDTRKRSDGD